MNMTEKRLLRFQLIGMLSLVMLLILALGSYFSYRQLRAFQNESLELEQNEQRERQMALTGLRNSSLAQISHLVASQDRQRDDALRQQVDQAIQLIQSLAAQPGSSQSLMLAALRPQRFFGGRGYFFIIDRSGNCLLNAGHPELEGRNLLDLIDSQGNRMVQTMLDTAFSEAGAGFVHYHWSLPGSRTAQDEKRTFVRAVPGQDWLVGTGEYLRHTRERLQAQALAQLADSQVGNSADSFLTIADTRGEVLLASGNPALSGQPLPADARLQDLIAGGGGLTQGHWPQLGDPARPQQLLLISQLPDWGWTLIHGLYLDSHTDNLARREELLQEQHRELIRTTLVALLLAPLLALILTLLYSRALARRFTQYRESLEASQARLRQYLDTDSLTGLASRQRLSDRLEHAILQAEASQSMLAVLCIDIDHFKHVNDSLGHAVGDQLLLAVSHQLGNALRPADTLCRSGGDEFIVLLENLDDLEQVSSLAEQLLQIGQQIHTVDSYELSVSLSLGIALYPLDGSDMQTLLKNADTALYHAKDCGRNNFQFFTSDLNQRLQEQLLLENHLRQALLRNEFSLCYQPKFDLHSGALTSCEALLRWHCPQLGEVSPGRFIPVAEHCGLISAIGEWVLESVCQQLASWQAAGQPRVPVAVNVSAHQFSHSDLPGFLHPLLQRTGVPGSLLELELTESVLAEDYEQLSHTLQQLRALGVTLSMDDFGTGFSSLSYLSHFHLDTLKIDRAFIRELPASGEHRALTEAIIAMARALGMHCIAEGIETPEQLEFLREHGCHTGQGYLLARPMPAAALQELLAHQPAASLNPQADLPL